MQGLSTVTRTFLLALPLAWSTFPTVLADTEQDQDIPALLARIDALEKRLREVEARLPASERAPLIVLPPETSTAPVRIVEENLDGAVSGSERVAAVAPQAEPARIDIGGALRYNLVHRDYSMPPTGNAVISGQDPCTSTAGAGAGTCSCRAYYATSTVPRTRQASATTLCEWVRLPARTTLPARQTSWWQT